MTATDGISAVLPEAALLLFCIAPNIRTKKEAKKQAAYQLLLAILESEKAHGAQHFIIVFHVVHTVILGQCAFEQGGQRFVRGIANAKHIYAIGTQAVTKIPVIFREMR